MSTEDTTKLIDRLHAASFGAEDSGSALRALIWNARNALESLVAENEKLRAESKEAHALAKDWYEESERGFDKIVAVREWFTENQEHEVYEATEDQPAECTDECSACALLEILNSHTAADGPLHALLTERHVLQAQLDNIRTALTQDRVIMVTRRNGYTETDYSNPLVPVKTIEAVLEVSE